MEYYECNPQKQPTVVVINLSYIEQELGVYMEKNPFGQYLKQHGYKVVKEHGDYLILRNGQG